MIQFDTLIENGTIVDGTRAPRFTGDLAIRDGKVVAISRSGLPAGDARQVIDASGLVVAGFIDGEYTGATPGRLVRHGHA